MKSLLAILIICNVTLIGLVFSYYYYYGPIDYHINLCEQKLEAGNAPRNIECVLAKEVFVPQEKK